MSETLIQPANLWTFEDATEHLLDIFEFKRARRREYRRVINALSITQRDLANLDQWVYYERELLISTVAPYSTGTITYTHSTRTVALDSGTFPTWARYGMLRIGNVNYTVESRTDATNVVLATNSNPGADVAAGTSYSLFRHSYPFPDAIRNIRQILDVEDQWGLSFTSGGASHALTQFYDGTGYPLTVALRGTNDFFGSVALSFSPAPDEARTYNVFYEANPRELQIERFSSGTITTSGTTVTMTGGAAWPESCVGSILRFTDQSERPTGKYGNADDTENPYTAQRVVVSRTSDTIVEIDTALSAEVTAKKYTLSDPLDVDHTAMLTAFLHLAEAEVARQLGSDSFARKMDTAQRSLILAKESNCKDTGSPTSVGYSPFTRVRFTADVG